MNYEARMNVVRTLLVLVMLLLVPTPEVRARSVDKINIWLEELKRLVPTP